MATQKKTVTIVKTGAGRDRACKIAKLRLHEGQQATWKNQTGGDVFLLFPHDGVLGRRSAAFCRKIKKGQSFTPRGKAARRSRGQEVYKYKVYCLATGTFAIGGSDPEIIVM